LTLQTLGKISEAAARRPQELAELKADGGKVVGWLNYNIPEELIYALGLTPIRLGNGGDESLVEVGGRYISKNNCVFVRETLGLFAKKQDPYFQSADLVAVDSSCLQIYRLAEVVEHYFKVKTAILGVPRNFYYPEGQEYFEKELAFFTKKLEAFSGTKLDKDKLLETIQLYNGIRASIQTLYTYQAADNPAITWKEVFDVVHAGFYLDRAQYHQLLNELLAELAATGKPTIGKQRGNARIFLSGSIIPPKDTKLISIVEQVGGRIVGDDLWSGLNSYIGVNIKEPTIKGIADAYVNRVPHGALPYLDLESDRRIKNLKQLISSFQAQGVIYHTLRYCDPYTFKTLETKEVLQKIGIPLLDIHTEYARSDLEAIRTRIETFVEILKSKHSLEIEA
jgi:benzoyl-CoA reductase/2-hydroxyglutaryl-CoA dehydratase subunit BcrC/BadD/HgdB